MSLRMTFRVDGECRHEGEPSAFGASSCVLMTLKHGGFSHLPPPKDRIMTWALPATPAPTARRAELTAVIKGMERALEIYGEFRARHDPDCYPSVTIRSDSAFAVVGAMQAADGAAVVDDDDPDLDTDPDSDLLRRAGELYDALERLGSIQLKHVPHVENWVVEMECNRVLDKEEHAELAAQARAGARPGGRGGGDVSSGSCHVQSGMLKIEEICQSPIGY